METAYRIECGNPTESELEATSRLLRLVYRHAPYLTPEYLRWQYLANPDGPAIALSAWDGKQLTGHVAAMPLRASFDGEVRSGMFLLNAAVHPQHTRRSIMRRITRAAIFEARKAGRDFCLGTGNKLSTRLFLRPFEDTSAFRLLAPLEARIGIGPPPRSNDRSPSFERVWSEESLQWRLANPERHYSVREEGGDLTVLAPSGKAGIGALLFHGPNRWRAASNGRIESGPLRLWIGLEPRSARRNGVYLPIPQRLRPSPLNLVYKDLRDDDAPIPDPNRIRFQVLDFDIF